MTPTVDLASAPLFILGLQRSGTTWIANIFDSSPETVLLFEPFAPQYNLFPQFPHEYFYIAPPSSFLSDLITNTLPELAKHKSVLFERADIGYQNFRIERNLARLLLRCNRFVRSSRLDFARQYRLLNLNRMGEDNLFFPKYANPTYQVIKELRLNFKIELLAHTLPKARFLFLVRHPAAVISSILSWFKKGRLRELRQNLEIFLECIAGQVVFRPYLDKIVYCRDKELEYKLALYWLINTELVLEQFDKITNTRVVIYEYLASDPANVTQQLFDFVGLKYSEQVRQYVQASSTTSSNKNSIIDTNRQSDTYYKRWQENLPAIVQKAVLEIAADSRLLTEIEIYY